MKKSSTSTLTIAPSHLMRGWGILRDLPQPIGSAKILAIGGKRAQNSVSSHLSNLDITYSEPVQECSQPILDRIQAEVNQLQPSFIMGIGGGKVLDCAKLIADRNQLPIATIPTSAATCAGWTALSNIYTEAGAFDHDVTLSRCPDWMIVDYEIIATAPPPTLISGIGDALAKWYEASVSSGHSESTLIISAVQSARVLRDILLQNSKTALDQPGGKVWQEVVDATIGMAGVIGGLGGAQCRTVAAHAIHNGLTHLPHSHRMLHGQKVAYGILVQLRLEEFQGNQLAATSRQQLLKFYQEIGLPCSLSDLQLGHISLQELAQVAEIACKPKSDIHHLPFTISMEQVQAAMVSTTAPLNLMPKP